MRELELLCAQGTTLQNFCSSGVAAGSHTCSKNLAGGCISNCHAPISLPDVLKTGTARASSEVYGSKRGMRQLLNAILQLLQLFFKGLPLKSAEFCKASARLALRLLKRHVEPTSFKQKARPAGLLLTPRFVLVLAGVWDCPEVSQA